MASRKQAQSANKRPAMGEDSAKNMETTPNPAAVLFNQTSRPVDAPAQETPSTSQKVLGNIATAANAMGTSGSTAAMTVTTNSKESLEGQTPTATAGQSGADMSLMRPHAEGGSQLPSLSVQTLRPGEQQQQQLTATTPTTPGFSATTPTTPFSPSATTPGGSRGKHTCPHCSQTFTRHHNLKSHLLTHSHEKPFLCNTCNARFRRLHDLKRHSKLHTGERPHVCPKCGRKFARGDALARHARAEGGCAGRRGSIAGVNDDGSIVMGEEDGMDGLEGLIDGDGDGDIDMIGAGNTDEGNRRRSLPSIRTDFSSGPPSGSQGGNPITPASGYTPNPHHNTYPPLGTPSNRTASTASGPSPAGLFPPTMSMKPNTPTSASPMQMSAIGAPTPTPTSAIPGGSGSMLSPHGALTDSPQNVSPAAAQGELSGDRARKMSGIQHSEPNREVAAAPTANMAPGPGNNFFTSLEGGIWEYVKGLEDRLRHLEVLEERVRQLEGVEARVRELEQELKQYKQQHAGPSTDQRQLQQETAQSS